MARYVATVETNRSPEDAFAYMADLTNFAAWDPGVLEAVQVSGDGAGPDATFDLTIAGIGRNLVLRYETAEFDAPSAVTVRATTRLFTSLDRITVEPTAAGSRVVYDAQLLLNGLLGKADVLLRPMFNRIAGRAETGLRAALTGPASTP